MILDNNQDRFGYYRVGDLKFYSRQEAAEVGKRLNQDKISWHFNDEVYSSYDWTKEPVASLPELYRKRAQQLREKYDYLVLHFSGGADSTNILDTFIDNDIKLDEVVSRVNYEATGDTKNFMNGEIFHVAMPKVEEAKLTQPWIRHTIIDAAPDAMCLLNNKQTQFDWIYQMNTFTNPNNLSQQNIKESQPHWRNMLAAGKKIGFIFGIDKPRVAGIGGKFSFYFIDTVDCAASPAMQIENNPGHYDELFYWSPDLPEIVIKQAHVIKRALKQLSPDSDWASRTPDGTAYIMENKRPLYLKVNGVHREIYPKWKKVGFQLKAMSLLLTPRDEWFYKLPDMDPAKAAWKRGLEHMWNIMPDYLKKDKNNMFAGYHYVKSKAYYLGE